MIPSTSSSRAVKPVQPAAGYIGGKRNLSRQLTAEIDAIDSPAFADVFVGMGGVFLRRRVRAPREFINDYSGDVANFFRMVREHPAYLIDQLRFRLASRAEFEQLRAVSPIGLTELQRAARFLQLQRLAFGGRVNGRSFGVAAGQGARFSAGRVTGMIEAIHQHLDGVTIEQLGYAAFPDRYDRPDMLFYLDPPYWGSETDYGQDLFARADFETLAAKLASLRGRFILSINDVPEIRAIFGAFQLEEAATTYQIGDRPRKARELIIRNFTR